MTERAIHTQGLTKRFGELRRRRRAGLRGPARARSSRCWGPTAPARRRRCGCWRRYWPRRRHAPASAATTSSREAARVRRADLADRQFAALDKNLTARENLVLMARLRGRGRREARRIADELIDRFDIGPFRDRLVKNALRRRAPPGRPRRRPDRPPATARARRADDRPGPPQPPGRVVDDPRAGRRRRHPAADHPVPRGGRRARRPGRADRPRPRGRRRHAGGAQGPGRRAAGRRHRRRQRGVRRARATCCGGSSSARRLPEQRTISIPAPDEAADLARVAVSSRTPASRSTRSRCGARRWTTPSSR